jgi:HSP90 family molecular chaperone
VVDSEDLPLNISRQALQDSALVAKLKRVVTKRFLKFLDEQAQTDPEQFQEFWSNFGQFFKEGMTTDYEYHAEIAKLLRFESSKSEPGKLISLADYAGRMQEEQKDIYYINGPNRAAIEAGPYIEAFKKQDIEVIYTLEPIDDFVLSHLGEFDGKKLVSADRADLNLPEAEETPAGADQDGAPPLAAEVVESLTKWLKDTLGARVKEVIVSKRLVDSPAIIVNPNGYMTSTMERVLHAASKETIELANKNLEINTHHPLIKQLAALRTTDEDFAKNVAEQIVDNAFIQAGLIVDAPTMVERSYRILTRALQGK